jgi:hypothetical protein
MHWCHGMIDVADVELFQFADDPETAFAISKEKLPRERAPTTPAFRPIVHIGFDDCVKDSRRRGKRRTLAR